MSRDPVPPGFHPDVHVEFEPLGPGAPEPRERAGPWRRVRTVLAFCALAALVGWATFSTSGDAERPVARTPPTPVPFTRESPSPIDEALRIVGVSPEVAVDLPGVWWGAVRPEAVAHSFGDAEPFPAGIYELRVACVGEGLVSFQWAATAPDETAPDETSAGALNLACHLPEKNGTGMVTLPLPGEIEFTASPRDDRAAGQAFFAVTITDPRAVLARDLLGPSGDTAVLSEVGVTAAPLGFSIDVAEPGRYQLTLVCVGTGPLRIDVRSVDGELTGQDSVCTDDGAFIYQPIEADRTGGISVTVRPLRGAESQAGYALRVDRLA